MLTDMLRFLIFLCSFLVSLCLANYEVTLDLMTCLQRSQNSLDSGYILMKWRGAKLENCNFLLIQGLKNGKICIEPLTFNNEHCSVSVQYSTTGVFKQFGDCDTKPSKICVTTDKLKLIVHANSSNSDTFDLRLSSETETANRYSNSDSITTDSNPTSKKNGLPLWAIIAITCGVFIPAILVVIIVAIICIRKNNHPKGHRYQVPQKELSTTANGSHDVIDPTTPIQRVSSVIEEEEDSPSDAGIRLSANV